MKTEEYKTSARRVGDWVADYVGGVERYPIAARTKPGEIAAQIPGAAPEAGEPMAAILRDFEDIILPGITHWQHPSFFGYFPANSSPPSVLAETLTAALGVISFNWDASPAATELEERMMEWLRQATGLPEAFTGMIQGSASEATLIALLTARERTLGFETNESGLSGAGRLMTYCSEEAHSSVEKAIRIAGLGSANLRRIATDDDFAMDPAALDQRIRADIAAGARPVCVIATLGTTGVAAFDPLRPIGEVCRRHGVWLHVDAAWAGSALILEDQRWMIDGVELADSFLFNPHKWLFTNFDCTAYFVQDTRALTRTLGIDPEYLKTAATGVTNYRDWSIPLGRRFRALKLWFVLRAYGLEGLRTRIRCHIDMARGLARKIAGEPDFELLAEPRLALLCFRYRPANTDDDRHIDELNRDLMARVNQSGEAYLSHTVIAGRFAIRFSIGQTATEQRHVDAAWELIKSCARDKVRS